MRMRQIRKVEMVDAWTQTTPRASKADKAKATAQSDQKDSQLLSTVEQQKQNLIKLKSLERDGPQRIDQQRPPNSGHPPAGGQQSAPYHRSNTNDWKRNQQYGTRSVAGKQGYPAESPP